MFVVELDFGYFRVFQLFRRLLSSTLTTDDFLFDWAIDLFQFSFRPTSKHHSCFAMLSVPVAYFVWWKTKTQTGSRTGSQTGSRTGNTFKQDSFIGVKRAFEILALRFFWFSNFCLRYLLTFSCVTTFSCSFLGFQQIRAYLQ